MRPTKTAVKAASPPPVAGREVIIEGHTSVSPQKTILNTANVIIDLLSQHLIIIAHLHSKVKRGVRESEN
jgi:hypothetical protein